MKGREPYEADEALDPEIAARFTLDTMAGPAPRVSTQAAADIVAGALAAAGAAGTGGAGHAARSGSKSLLKAASLAGAGLVLAGAAAALYARSVAPAEPSVAAAPSAHPTSAAAPAATDAVPATSSSSLTDERAAVPDDMLDRANRVRAAGDFAGAERLYARVFEQHPGTLAAYVARVAAASIRVDHLDDAGGARALLRQALRERPNGALDLEVRSGLSKAERLLGDRAAEREALQRLVQAHPGSLAAERARERLREIDDEPASSAR